MYVTEIIYRFSYCELVSRRSPLALLSVVELPNPAVCSYYRFARVRVAMLCYERNSSFACFGEIIYHSLYGKSLPVRNFCFFKLHFKQYVFSIVILNQSINVCRVDASIKFQTLEINELLCVVRILNSASFRNYHLLVFGDRLQSFQQLSLCRICVATCFLLGAPQ